MVPRLMGWLALPPKVLLRAAHRTFTGREAVLDVPIEGIADLLQRDRFLRRLRGAARDPRVCAVVLRLREPPAGWAASQDLRSAIAELRASGRKVYAWLEAPGNAVMALAAACDRVFVVPTGEVGLVGVGVELTFFGAALARLGVRPDFEAAGAYKSFGEPWTRSFPSPANHEAVRELVEDLHDQLLVAIADGRNQPVEHVRAVLDRAPLSAEEALREGLVDELLYEDQLEAWLEEHHGSQAHLVSFRGWALREALVERLGLVGRTGGAIAVLHLQGPITLEDGGRSNNSIVARDVLPVLKQLREDDSVSAVVLHVDSPGGSALASDLLWREVTQLKRQKPVVAAFEDVAASGGFYLSAPANVILVRPGTLTGSIGVFGGKLVLGEGLRRVGVHTQEVLAAPNANLYSPTRPFTAGQRERFKASLQRFYDGFVGRVAEGRGVAVAEIEPHCRGRVWTGRAALDRGLVDEAEAGLDAAIERARGLAQLPVDAWQRRDLVGHKEPFWTKVVQGLVRQVVPSAARVGLELADRLVGGGRDLAEVVADHPNEPLAMLPFDVKLR